MQDIFNALNPGNQNEELDCCNENLKCKEKNFLKKCISGNDKTTFTYNIPELTCDISPKIRKFIFLSGISFRDFLNDNIGLLIKSIRENNFDRFGMLIPLYLYITIFDSNLKKIIFTNSPLELRVSYDFASNAYFTATGASSAPNSISFTDCSNTLGLSLQAPKTPTKPSIICSSSTTFTTTTIVNAQSAQSIESTSRYLIAGVSTSPN